MLRQNESALDRIIRALIGIALAVVTFTVLSGVAQIIAGIVAALLLVTAAVGFCPLYALLRIGTKSSSRTA
ncbi:MAG TPA: DUF2892 domain-containing protein [Ktedonobacterales bacterium]